MFLIRYILVNGLVFSFVSVWLWLDFVTHFHLTLRLMNDCMSLLESSAFSSHFLLRFSILVFMVSVLCACSREVLFINVLVLVMCRINLVWIASIGLSWVGHRFIIAQHPYSRILLTYMLNSCSIFLMFGEFGLSEIKYSL